MKTITATTVLFLREVFGDWYPISVSVDPDDDLVILASAERPNYRVRARQRYRIFHGPGEALKSTELPETRKYYTLAEALSGRRWLLLEVLGDERNEEAERCHVLGAGGEPIASFHAGQHVKEIKTTWDEQTWIAFGDVGIVSRDQLANSGLACLSDKGEPTFRYNELWRPGRSHFMDHCNAMNVEGDSSVWAYHRGAQDNMCLVQVVDRFVWHLWDDVPVHGACSFAVTDDAALFAGSYHRRNWLFHVRLGSNRRQALRPVDEDGAPILFDRFSRWCFGRGQRLYLRDAERLYVIDMGNL